MSTFNRTSSWLSVCLAKIVRLTVLGVGLGAASLAGAGTVTGRVTDEQERPLVGIPVSDGISVVCTGEDGRFAMNVKGGQPFLFVHQPTDRHGAPWFFRRPQTGRDYSFVLKQRDPAAPRSFVQISDSETTDFSWLSLLRECRPDFLVHTGDLCRKDGIVAHAAHLTEEAVGCPVYFAVGNHDMVSPWGDGVDYAALMPPYYYSLGWGPYLVVVAPMWTGENGLPYDMQDFGDWLASMQQVFPKRPIIVLSHDMPQSDPGALKFPGHDGRTADLSSQLVAWLIGHHHSNFARKLANGALLLSTAPPEFGGIDHSPASFREVRIASDGRLKSQLHWSVRDPLLSLTAPSSNWRWRRDGHEWLSAVGWSPENPIASMKAEVKLNGKTVLIPLQSAGLTWEGQLPEPASAIASIGLVAELRDGKQLRSTFDILVDSKTTPKLEWLAKMDSESFMTAPVVGHGAVFTAATDDHNGENAAIYGWDAATGKLKWKYATGDSICNTIAYADGLVFAQDKLGNVYAIHAADGTLAWKDPNPTPSMSPTTNGLTVHDGVLYAGTRLRLSAYEPATGKLLWRNHEWNGGEPTVSTVQVGEGLVVTAGNWDGLVGFDAKTGKLQWKVSSDSLNFQSAAVCFRDGKIYAKGNKALAVIEARTGKVLKTASFSDNIETAAAPVFAEDVLVVGGAQMVHGLDATTLKERWRFQTLGSSILATVPYLCSGRTLESTPVLWQGLLWFGASDGNLYAVRPTDGVRMHAFHLGAPVFAAACPRGDSLFLTDFCGRVYCLKHNRLASEP